MYEILDLKLKFADLKNSELSEVNSICFRIKNKNK